ncbi:Zinc finger protein CONSTANS-LIKE 5 [Tetrabaena socialis]|uniref:Zinc finger protein CONSTANS-LIKE 5 n=1 Tax=Tetrabaena socialis TaxID=47790 RepID=A0A2J8AB52_9CHLO|nr:Zinc finger protein CONSTANS-LIKE 5 [Tetrabaena socialis]|eukprot:PNH09754.1 Zinc finger protein CONSTANS-LIKE 5 [Tetrabaena socialis]
MASCVVCSAPASIYCDNDKAMLCKDCDVRIHTSNAVAARHTRRPTCQGCQGGVACYFNRHESAFLCEPCHSANPLSATHEVEPVVPLPTMEQELAMGEQQLSFNAPCESVAQSAASPAAWFVEEDKPSLVFVGEAAVMSPAGSEAVVPVMSASFEDFSFSAPATFKEIKDKLEFESLELDNGWMEMGFDFSDILSDAPSDAGLVPTFDADAADALADALVPSFTELPSIEVPAPKPSRKRAADASEEERTAKVPVVQPVVQQPSFLPQPASIFFQTPQLLPQAVLLPPAAQPKNTAAYNAALAAGAYLTREQRVARYREKRKNRKFEKTIRYASRKAYAEIRPRIKGRFAKKEEIEAWKAAHGEDAVVPEILDGEF